MRWQLQQSLPLGLPGSCALVFMKHVDRTLDHQGSVSIPIPIIMVLFFPNFDHKYSAYKINKVRI